MIRNLLYAFACTTLIVSCGGFGGEDTADFDPVFGEGISQGGSLARFTIIGDYLYVVNDNGLIPINISVLGEPEVHSMVDLGIGIETIFPFGDVVLIGSQSAMYIVRITDPERPEVLSVYEHFTACDPVVAKGDFAYVTLRDGTNCQGWAPEVNVLDILDISNMNWPNLVASVPMTNPRGLGIGCNNKLYVCEGPTGFVQFDISNPAQPIREVSYGAHHANDVIIRDSLLIFTGEDGITQYYCQEDTLELISVLPYAL